MGGWCGDYKPRQLPRSALPLPLLGAAPRRQRTAHAWPRHELRSGAMLGGGGTRGWRWGGGCNACSEGMAALVKPRCCAGSHPAFVPAVAVCTEPGALLSPHLRSALLSSPFLCFPLPVPQLCPQLHGPIPPHVPSFHARAALQRCGATQPGAVRCSALDARRRGVEFLSSTFGLPLESAAGRSSADPLQAVALAKHRRACKGLLREDALIAIQHRKAPWCVCGGQERARQLLGVVFARPHLIHKLPRANWLCGFSTLRPPLRGTGCFLGTAIPSSAREVSRELRSWAIGKQPGWEQVSKPTAAGVGVVRDCWSPRSAVRMGTCSPPKSFSARGAVHALHSGTLKK